MAETRAARGNRAASRPVLSLTVFVVLLAGLVPLSLPSKEAIPLHAGHENTHDVLNALDSLGGYFIENRGQVNELVRYYSTGNPSVAFRDDGLMFVLRGRGESEKETNRLRSASSSFPTTAAEQPASWSFAYLVHLEGANIVAPIGRGELPFKSNFFLGNQLNEWRTDVPNYREVVYDDVYDGVDLVYGSRPEGVKYQFVVQPGSNPGAIRLAYDGVESPHIGEGGMTISTPLGDVMDSIPYSYEEGGKEVDCVFAAKGGSTYGFDCGARDPSKPLIIDPLVYSTYIGGNDDNEWCGIEVGDRGSSIATDAAGNAYVYGATCSPDFPVTPGAFNTTYWITGQLGDQRQAFVAKLNPAGNMLVYATYLGAINIEIPTSIAVDSAGNAYLTGATTSAGLQPGTDPFPTTPGAFDTTFDIFARNVPWYNSIWFTEAFVTKLNPQGNGLVYSTFLGGNRYEYAWSIAVDSAGNAYLAGETNGTDFPTTPGAFDRTFNSNYGIWDYPDIFVTKLNAAGSDVVYSTYIGGSGYEWARSISVDFSGNAYITGETNSSNFPVTLGAFDTSFGGRLDGFVTKLNAAGSSLLYSTFLGGESWELSYSVAVDSSGSAYVTGMTNSTTFPTTAGAYGRILKGGRDAYITKLDPAGSGLVYSTFLGGNSPIDAGLSIAVDSLGTAFVTGYTYSGDFPVTPDAFDTVFNDREGFIARMNASGTGLLYSTFIGGRAADEQGSAITLDQMGIAYVTGWTNSSDFPTTPGAFSRTLDNFTDAFVVKLNPVTAADPPDLTITSVDIISTPASPVMVGTSVMITAFVHNIGGTNATSVVVRFFDGPPSPPNRIGTDQVIGTIDRFFGVDHASVFWTATPLGMHSICVVVDPDNAISEKREDNNQACAPIEVVPQMPDLEVTSSDVILLPPSPFVEGTDVQVSATVRNIGALASGATVARFHDGIPPSPTIGTDQPIGPLAVGGSTTVSVTWRASPPGPHKICVAVDPGNLVVEINETNNQACVNVRVLALPDLAPTMIATAPVPPLLEGTHTWLNVTAANIGGTPAGTFDVLLFYDSNGNKLPDVGENIGLSSVTFLMSGSLRVVPFVWTASPAGTLSICANADPSPGNVTESNEMNNVWCINVVVKPKPVTMPDYVPVLPEPPPPIRVGLSLPVSLSIVVHNQGNATATNDSILAFYNESSPANPFASFMVSAVPPGGNSSRFTATWTSPAFPGTYNVAADVDHGNNATEWDETNNVYTWTIEVVSGPITSLVIGNPNYTSTATYVKSSTPLDLSVLDQSSSGINHTWYRLDNFSWIEYSFSFFLSGDGDHYVEYYSEDKVGNVEDVSWQVVRVDDSPPATAISIGEPKYLAGGNFIKSWTLLTLFVADGGIGPNSTFYRLWEGSWSQWRDYSTSFGHAGTDRTWFVEFLSFDYLGNMEAVQNETLVLDNSPPVTTISPAAPFTLTATDSGCGVNVTMYRIDGGSWTVYTGGFTLTEGEHAIYYYSIDNLGNVEQERSLVVRTPVEVAVNHKPIVAMVFAIILLVAGVWSSKRRPWKSGKDKMAVARAFMIISMPFVVAEAVTGVVSLVTGQLSIPPLLGTGTGVDLAILIAGLLIAFLRIRKTDGALPRSQT